MTCKPESQKQRLERIAVQILAGLVANPECMGQSASTLSEAAIGHAIALTQKLDELPPIE